MVTKYVLVHESLCERISISFQNCISTTALGEGTDEIWVETTDRAVFIVEIKKPDESGQREEINLKI